MDYSHSGKSGHERILAMGEAINDRPTPEKETMSENKRGLTGRSVGRPAIMSRESIGRAALAELDGISSTKVAKRLGVGQSSLYRHITDRADLVRLAVDFGLTQQEWPEPGDSWRGYLLDFATSFWNFLDRHPGASQEIKMMRPSPAGLISAATKIAQDLMGFGFSAADANMAVDVVGHITMDTMISEEIFRSRDAHGVLVRDEQRAAWSAQEDPVLAAETLRAIDDGMYRLLLERTELLLDGFEFRLSKVQKVN